MRKPIAWMKELVPQKGLEWQVVLTAHEEMAKDWEEPVIPLYTKQEWVGLTDEEKAQFVVAYYPSNWDRKTAVSLMSDYEKYLKEKNHV